MWNVVHAGMPDRRALKDEWNNLKGRQKEIETWLSRFQKLPESLVIPKYEMDLEIMKSNTEARLKELRALKERLGVLEEKSAF
jgi:hypothetical protein